MKKLFIPVILGTSRKGRRSEVVARYILEKTKETGCKTQLIDPRRWLEKPQTENAMSKAKRKKWKQLMGDADGYIIVSPEYNHSYPSELKLLLDCAYEEYEGKPVGLVGVSKGMFAGTRVVEVLRLLSGCFGMYDIKQTMQFPNMIQGIDKKGNLKNQEEYNKRFPAFFQSLADYALRLRMEK